MNKQKWYTLITYSFSVLILLFIILARYFVFDYIILDNHSMEPNYSSNHILINSRIFKPERFDTVVIKDEDKKSLVRIIGIPGDHVKFEYDALYINDKKIDETYLIDYLDHYNNDTIQQIYGKMGLKLPSDQRAFTQDKNMQPVFEVALGEDEYYVLGDNRPFAIDSRSFGKLKYSDLYSETLFKLPW